MKTLNSKANPGFAMLMTAGVVLAGFAALVHTAAATPVAHSISAANVTVVQNDTGNTSASVTLVPTLVINQMVILNNSQNSRADYFFQIGGSPSDDVANGIAMSAITDNGRDNGEGNGVNYGTSAIDSSATATPGSSGQYWVPVFGSPTIESATFPEYNFDYAVAYFPYSNYFGGWIVNKGGTNNSVVTNIASDKLWSNTNMVLGTDVIPLGGGQVKVNLTRFGLDCRSNAIMLCVGGKNEENFAVSEPNSDGSWTVQTRDDISGSLEADPSAFVCIPLTNHSILAGRFMGDSRIAQSNGVFAVSNTAVGTYHLTIPNVTPGHGVLIISGECGGTYNSDNIVSYQATADGWDIQTRDCGSTGTAAAPNLQNLPGTDAVVSFAYIPAPTPGFTVTPTNGLVTSENGASATFTVVLDAPPTAEVDLTPTSSQPAYGTVSPTTLAFTANNWNVPQTVTVTGVANTAVSGGVQPYTISFAPASSADTNYDGMAVPSVSVVQSLNDLPGVTVWPTNGLVTTESGGAAEFSVFLNSAPASDVSVNLSSSNPSEGTVSTFTLTFNSANWQTPQVVTVTGVDDSVVDGNQTYSIINSATSSQDASYNGLDVPDVGVVNLDNEVAGVSVSAGGSVSVIEGQSTNFSVVLTAQPVSSVTIAYASSAPSFGTVSPSSVTFTPANWNTPQTFTLAGVNNSLSGSNASYVLNGTISTTNPGYSTLVLPAISAITVEPTAVILSSNQTIYGFGMPPVGIDGQAIVTDSTGSALNGAKLTVTLVKNGGTSDALGIRSEGRAAGQVGVSNNFVTYSGVSVGTFSGGASTTPLSISFSNGVSVQAVQAIVQALTFSTASSNSYLMRTVQLTLNDGAGTSVSASKTIRVGLVRSTQYQDGADFGYGTYSGEQDIELDQATPSTANPAGGTSGLFVDAPRPGYPEETQVLMRFDSLVGTNAGQIPLGSTIISAELYINIVNSGNGFSLNRMLVGWDATNATWNSFSDGYGDNGVFLDDITATSTNASQLGVYIVDPNTGAIGGGSTGTGDVSIGVTPDIQAWVSGETNYGWVFKGWTEETDGLGFSPSEDPSVTNHPRLRVLWVPAGTPSVSFRYGVNGYTNVEDVNIRQATGDTNYAIETTLWSDANDVGQADQTEYLIQFGNIIGTDTNQIPAGAHIETAMLDLTSVNSTAAIGDRGQFVAMRESWQDTNTTWNSWGTDGIQTNGVQAATTPTVTIGSPTLSPNVQETLHSLDVTSDVQNWVNGTQANNGWAAIPWPGGSDGWGSNSSEDPTVVTRPQLRVFYTPGTPTLARPTLKVVSVSASKVVIQLSGAANSTYTVQRASSLIGGWSNAGTAATDGTGAATFTDSAPLSGAAFYRTSN